MPFTTRFEYSVAAGGSVRTYGSLDAATTRVLAAMEESDEIAEQEVFDAMQDAMETLEDEWIRISPFQSGAYIEGINTETVPLPGGDVEGNAFNTARHAQFVERGTAGGGTGYIRPRRARLKIDLADLAYQPTHDQLGFLWVKRVRGQRAQHVLENAHRNAKPLMTHEFREAAAATKRRIKTIL